MQETEQNTTDQELVSEGSGRDAATEEVAQSML